MLMRGLYRRCEINQQDVPEKLQGQNMEEEMAKLNALSQTNVDRVKEIGEKVKDIAQTTSSNVRDSVQSGVDKTQEAMMTRLGLVQELFKNNEQKAQKNLIKAQQNIRAAQERLQPHEEQAMTALSTGLDVAQGILLEVLQKKYLWKKLKKLQDSMQENLEMGRDKAQEALSQSSQKASKSISQVASNAKDLKDVMQDRYESYRRRRKGAQILFRWGLLTGFVLILLYTPIPGSEFRSRLVIRWQQYRSFLGV